ELTAARGESDQFGVQLGAAADPHDLGTRDDELAGARADPNAGASFLDRSVDDPTVAQHDFVGAGRAQQEQAGDRQHERSPRHDRQRSLGRGTTVERRRYPTPPSDRSARPAGLLRERTADANETTAAAGFSPRRDPAGCSAG